jgi:hypothetical protein
MVGHFVTIQKTGPKKRLENGHSKTGRSGFRMLTVVGYSDVNCSINSLVISALRLKGASNWVLFVFVFQDMTSNRLVERKVSSSPMPLPSEEKTLSW